MIGDIFLEAFYFVKDKARRSPRLNAVVEQIRNKKYFGSIDIHERMLADDTRVDAYYHAIKRHISNDDIVIDLGTGTGILSFFAAKQGAKQVYAIDHSDIIEMAQFLAKENKVDNVTFNKVHSRNFTIDHKVNAIIHEQMGSELFNEYMISNICDLRDRLLIEGGKILPAKFELFLEPVRLKDTYRMPFLWERDLHGVHFGGLKKWIQSNPKMRESLGASMHRRVMPCEVDYFLCNPEKVFLLDLYTAQPSMPNMVWKQHKPVTRSGEMDGFCLYFRASFDDEISIDNSPFSPRTNWNCHFIRTEALHLNEGDILEVTWQVDDISNIRSWQHPIYRRVPA